MKILNKKNLIDYLVPIILFAIYSHIYQILAYSSRFILLYNDNKYLFYSCIILSNLIAIVISFSILRHSTLKKETPFKKYLRVILILIFVFIAQILMQSLISEVMDSRDSSALKEYYKYLSAQHNIRKIFNVVILVLVGIKLLMKGNQSEE